ncbi:hypothetical protein V6Z12_D06G051600 [Gossypium hirsutum]
MLLHEKAVEALNPLAREFKSMGTMKKETCTSSHTGSPN